MFLKVKVWNGRIYFVQHFPCLAWFLSIERETGRSELPSPPLSKICSARLWKAWDWIEFTLEDIWFDLGQEGRNVFVWMRGL